MNKVKIVAKKSAMTRIPKITTSESTCYYLANDYDYFISLRDKFAGRIKRRNLSGLFCDTFQEIKGPFLELIAKLNKKHSSLEWWGSQIASRNPASTQLLHNITYLMCVKKIIADLDEDIIFIVNSHALSVCIANIASEAGYQVAQYRNRMCKYLEIIHRWLFYVAKIIIFFWKVFQSRRAAFKLLAPIPSKVQDKKKRILIRSWITKGTFDQYGEFKDRNFGNLPHWLRSKNHQVWTLPMFFDLPITIEEVYTLMKKQKQQFLIPDHYLKFSDYLKVLQTDYRMLRKKVKNVIIQEMNVTPIFNEVLKEQGYNPSLLILNLCYPMLKRLKEMETDIDGFYYPFENNLPEKIFILGCREFYPESKIIGFQHTTFFPNQLAYNLGPDEKYYHPLPDKLVCSGPIYLKLYKEAGFPPGILVPGPNLRFESVYVNKPMNRRIKISTRKILMAPLPGLPDYDLAFEFLMKVKDALVDMQDYKLYIRNHPVLSKKVLIEFMEKIRMEDYEFADEGILQDWLPKTYSVISPGTSITILETVSMGIPVIRIIPDNTVFYDPFIWPAYPLAPINTASEIKKQLQLIENILQDDKETFQRIGKRVLSEYFTKPTEENMQVFL